MQSDFGRIIDALPGLVWTALPDGQADFLNQRWCEYTGLSTEQAIREGWQGAVHPDDLPRMLEYWLPRVAAGEEGEVEARLRRFDGAYRWFSFRFTPVKDSAGNIVKWCGLNTDIEDMTERKRSDEALRTSEQNARAMVDGIPGLVAVFSADGFLEYVNQPVTAFWGKPVEQLRDWTAAGILHPDDAARTIEAFGKAFATKTPFTLEVRALRHDGTYRWLESRGAPLKDANGRIVRWYNLLIDIDERKRAEEALSASERDLKSIIDVTPALIWSATPEGNTEHVNQHFLDYIGLSPAHMKTWVWDDIIHRDDAAALAAVWRKLQETGEGGQTEARIRRHDGEYRWFLLRANPLRDESGKIVKWYGVNTDIEDRKRAEEALAASERNLKQIIDTTPALIWSPDANGRIASVNQHYLDYVGMPLDEMPQKGWEIIHPEDVGSLSESWKRIMQLGVMGQTEARLRRYDGEYRWFLFRANPMRDENGKIVKWYGVNTDIEDRKRAEAALQDNERSLQEIIDATPVQLWSTTPEGAVTTVNKHYLDFVGASLEQTLGWGWLAAVHPDDKKPLTEAWRAMLAAGIGAQAEARYRRHDGQYRWFLLRASPIRDKSGTIVRWYGVSTDIEDRKRAETSMRLSEQMLQHTIDATPAMLWSADADGIMDVVNQTYVDYVGTPFDENDRAGWVVKAVHPEDRRALFGHWDQMIRTGVAGSGEARLRRHDGVYRWFQFRGNPMRDESGKVVRWYCVTFDIDDRKLAEAAVAASERYLRQTINAIPVIAYCNSADGPNEFLNQRWHDYTGLSAEDARSGGWQQALHPDDRPEMLAKWLAFLKSGESGEIEGRMRRHDGEYRSFVFRSDALRDASGRIVKWYGTCTDIEDRKRADEALRTSERNLKLIIDTTPALIWATNAEGSTEVVSQHYLDYVGLSLEQLQGWGWSTALHPDDLEAVATVWRGLLAAGVAGEAEGRLRRHDGTYRWFLIRANPMRDANGTIVSWYGVNTDIEARKQAESELRRAHGHLTEAQRLSKTGSFTADTHRDDHVWSEELYRIFEVEPAATVRIQTIRDRTHPEDLPVLDAALKRGIAGMDDVDFGIRIVLPSGTLKHVHVAAHRIAHIAARPVYFGAIQDVTDAKLAEDALRRSEAFLAQGEAVSDTGSFLWRLETGEIKWSDQLYRIFEIEPGMPITLERIASQVHPEDAPLMENMVARARLGQPSQYEHRIIMPDRRLKHLHFVAEPTRDDDGKPAYMGSVQDVTDRRHVEQALSKVRSELAHVSRVSSLGALTASIAHEVNQPLAGIVTNASTCLRMLAADPPNVEGARETARRTIRDGNRASEVISRLRALFTKREASVEPVDLNEAAQEVLALSVNELRRGRVTLRQEFAGNLPQVPGDRVQLQQVILNLILNASDAMSDIDDRQRQLVIRTELDEDDHVRFDVQDSGAGIDPQSASKLFDAFFTTKPGGMGIGLSVSRAIIERHQGRLWARSNQGPGATFSFAIPRGDDAAEAMRQR